MKFRKCLMFLCCPGWFASAEMFGRSVISLDGVASSTSSAGMGPTDSQEIEPSASGSWSTSATLTRTISPTVWSINSESFISTGSTDDPGKSVREILRPSKTISSGSHHPAKQVSMLSAALFGTSSSTSNDENDAFSNASKTTENDRENTTTAMRKVSISTTAARSTLTAIATDFISGKLPSSTTLISSTASGLRSSFAETLSSQPHSMVTTSSVSGHDGNIGDNHARPVSSLQARPAANESRPAVQSTTIDTAVRLGDMSRLAYLIPATKTASASVLSGPSSVTTVGTPVDTGLLEALRPSTPSNPSSTQTVPEPSSTVEDISGARASSASFFTSTNQERGSAPQTKVIPITDEEEGNVVVPITKEE